MKTLFDKNLTFEEAEELIRNGADVNLRCAGSYTPLHFIQNVKVARLLIDHGADVNAQDHVGRTPLHHASLIDIIKLLVNNNANVNAISNAGRTPIDEWLNKENICYLLKNGADINATKNGSLSIRKFDHWNDFFIKNGAVPSTILIYKHCRDLFTQKQKNAFDSFLLLTNDDHQFFQMCLTYQNDQKNKVKIEIKDMEIL